jgi:ProP effector
MADRHHQRSDNDRAAVSEHAVGDYAPEYRSEIDEAGINPVDVGREWLGVERTERGFKDALERRESDHLAGCSWLKHVLDEVALAARFPSTFVADPVQSHRPLKIGIGNDLVAAGFPAREANAALKTYTGRPAYQRVVATAGYRVDLDGNVAGEVTDGQRRYAEARARRLEARQSAEAAAKANGEGRRLPASPQRRRRHRPCGLHECRRSRTSRSRCPRHPTKLQAPATPPAPPRSSDGRFGLADLRRLAQERKQRALEEAAACSSV